MMVIRPRFQILAYKKYCPASVRENFCERALLGLGCSAGELASKYRLPYRSVARWLAGSASPGPQRLRKLCHSFNWKYEAMFSGDGLEDEAFERQQMSLLIEPPISQPTTSGSCGGMELRFVGRCDGV